MNINETLKKVMIYKDQHDFNNSASSRDIELAIIKGAFIPKDYIELLKVFNGGELFVPGTVMYGITRYKDYPSLFDTKGTSELFSIPKNYLIIGHLNFGDIICINTEPPYDIIQWDHETDEKFLQWSSIDSFLNEQIEDYLEYEESDV